MKRSVIQLAGKTHVISLPSKWVKKYNIKKGDELEINEENESLRVCCNNEEKEKKISIDITDFNATLIWHSLLSLYKEGYDEIDVHFDNTKARYERTNEIVVVLHLLQDITDYCMGMEIVKHGKNNCVLREVSKVKADEFDILFRRMHYSILNLLNDGVDAINNKDYELLKTLAEHSEKSINKLTGTCIRAFNKNNNSPSNLVLVYNLENIGDCIEGLFSGISKNKTGLDSGLFDILIKSKELFSKYSDLFYRNDIKEINKMHREIILFIERLNNFPTNNIRDSGYLHNVLNLMFYLTDSISVGLPHNLLNKIKN